MKIRTCLILPVLGFVTLGFTANGEEKKAGEVSPYFEAIKQLAGDWVAVDKDGKPTDKVAASFRVTAAGSTVVETMMPGTDHEMVTIYHMDGKDLILTHYCALGNQPRMKAEPGADPKKIVFKLVSCSNLKSPDAMHMDQATLMIEGKDRYKSEWISCKDGKACHTANFDHMRK